MKLTLQTHKMVEEKKTLSGKAWLIKARIHRRPVRNPKLLAALWLVLAGWLAASGPVRAQTFTNTGPMSTTRTAHTATLLFNGEVLVAGGSSGASVKKEHPIIVAGSTGEAGNGSRASLPAADPRIFDFVSVNASTELYHLTTGVWATTGQLNNPRYEHTATLLDNGQVLAAGGNGGGGSLTSVEIYTSATGVWTNTSSLNIARENHTATLLPNGEVLVAGGDSTGTTAELYNPATAAWTFTGSMTTNRYSGHTATLLPNGLVLVAGGRNAGPLAGAELYNSTTGSWTPTGAMNQPRAGHTAHLLTNGLVLVVGGDAAESSAELYNPATGSWTITGSLNSPRANFSSALLLNGEVLVAGGYITTCAELYNPATGSWAYTGFMNNPRYDFTAIVLTNSQVLVAGSEIPGSGYGLNDAYGANNSAELYGTSQPLPAISIGDLAQDYTETARPVSVTSAFASPLVQVTYNGLVNAPVNPGSYTVIATLGNPPSPGGATGTLVIPQPVIALKASPGGVATTTGAGAYSVGAVVTVSAVITNDCYDFTGWWENGLLVTSAPVYIFTMTTNRSLAATFSLINYTITAGTTGAGTVSVGGTAGCGSEVTLVATPNPGSSFLRWLENGTLASTSPAYSFTVTGNRTLEAIFSSVLISTTTAPPGAGTIQGGGIKLVGTNVTLTATPVKGCQFVNWKLNGNVVGNAPRYAFTATTNTMLTANFLDTNAPTVAIKNPASNQICSNQLFAATGTVADNVAVSNVFWQVNGAGWQPAQTANAWTNWTARVPLQTGTNRLSVKAVDTSGNVSAISTVSFVYVLSAPLTVAINGGGTVTPNFNGVSLILNKSCTLTATPALGCVFIDWTGRFFTNTAKLTFVMTSNLVLTANFLDIQPPTLTIQTPSAGLNWTNAALLIKGRCTDNVGVAAVYYQLNQGGWFKASSTNNWTNWFANVALNPGINSLQVCALDTSGNPAFTGVTFNYYLTARPTVQIASGSGKITPNYNGQLLQVGNTYTMTATPALGYLFQNWQGSSSSTEPQLTFVMEPGLNFQANFGFDLQPLVVTVSLSSTNVMEGGTFQVDIHVVNQSSHPITGISIDGETLGYASGATSGALPTKYMSPVITQLATNASVDFIQPFQAETAGSFQFAFSVESSAGQVGPVNSPTINVLARTPGSSAISDAKGLARVVSGGNTLQIQLADEETGSTLSGFALGLALDPNRDGQAVLAAVDTSGRYPPQLYLLQGTVAGATPTFQMHSLANASATPEATAGNSPVLNLPVDQACGGPSGVYQSIMAPITTTALPPLAPLSAPPSPTLITGDNFQPAAQVVLTALQSALQTAKNFVFTQKEVACDEVLADDALSVAAGKVEDLLLGEAPKKFLRLVAPGTSGIYEAFMAADTVNTYIQSFQDLALCNDSSGSDVLLQTTLLPQIQHYFPSSLLTWNSLPAAETMQYPLSTVSLAVTDAKGNPISGGSLQMISTDELGTGFRAVIGNGTADLPVVVGNYQACVRSPGYLTQSQQIPVPVEGTNISVVMVPQSEQSATLTTATGQTTGFLPKGTKFKVTPHFFDANGNEVACQGTPIFYAHNPVGSSVATVDPGSGFVTIGNGCGAALVYAWCGGIESRPMLVSSDCNGSEPPVALSTFAINPTSLTFSAVQNQANPAEQNVYLVNLGNVTLDYTATANRSWITVSPNGGVIGIGVNISGLAPGTYSGAVQVVDNNKPANHSTINVTLVVTAQPVTNVAGTWTGNYNNAYDGFGDLATFNVTWVLHQSGHSVSGTYSSIETDSLGSGTPASGQLVDGSVTGNSFVIYDDGGFKYAGTVAGTTISGAVNPGMSDSGTFSVTKK